MVSWHFDELDSVVEERAGERFAIRTQDSVAPVNVSVGGGPDEKANRQAITVIEVLIARHRRDAGQRATNGPEG